MCSAYVLLKLQGIVASNSDITTGTLSATAPTIAPAAMRFPPLSQETTLLVGFRLLHAGR